MWLALDARALATNGPHCVEIYCTTMIQAPAHSRELRKDSEFGRLTSRPNRCELDAALMGKKSKNARLTGPRSNKRYSNRLPIAKS